MAGIDCWHDVLVDEFRAGRNYFIDDFSPGADVKYQKTCGVSINFGRGGQRTRYAALGLLPSNGSEAARERWNIATVDQDFALCDHA